MRKTQEITQFEERPAARSLNMPALIEDFLAAQDIRPISKEVYRKGMERFFIWIESNQISQPDREIILRFKTYLIESNLAANTVNSYLVAVKRFFAYLEGSRLYPDIAKGVKGVKQPKSHLREALTISQVKEMLAIIDVSTIQGKRDFAMINLMARTGLRTIEVVRADVDDIRQQGGEAMRHASIETTQKYIHNLERIEKGAERHIDF